MTTDQNRAAFEAWCVSTNCRVPAGTEWNSPLVSVAWDAWQAAHTIHAGWQLVPIEPTPEMLASQHKDAATTGDAFDRQAACAWLDQFTRKSWAEMLAAAPKAPRP